MNDNSPLGPSNQRKLSAWLQGSLGKRRSGTMLSRPRVQGRDSGRWDGERKESGMVRWDEAIWASEMPEVGCMKRGDLGRGRGEANGEWRQTDRQERTGPNSDRAGHGSDRTGMIGQTTPTRLGQGTTLYIIVTPGYKR